MIIAHNYLRMYRKKSHLTQNDIAFMADIGDYSNVSRWEYGQRQPNIETLLIYHLLFNLPIELLFERQKHELIAKVVNRAKALIEMLKENPEDTKATQRISFLYDVISRLNALAASRYV